MTARTVQRVIERLIYEGLLIHNQYQGRRWRVTLQDLLTAGKHEPRILELLPGIILHRQKLIHRCQHDLRRHPDIQTLLKKMSAGPPHHAWHGIPISDMQRTAQRMAELQQHRLHRQRWRNLNIRISDDDLARLQRLAARTQQTKSGFLRGLIEKAARE